MPVANAAFELQEKSCEWYKIEDVTNIQHSCSLVDTSSNLVEARSLTEFIVLSRFRQSRSIICFKEGSRRFWRRKYKLLQLVVHHSVQVEILNLHDHFQGDEVDNAVICCRLVS